MTTVHFTNVIDFKQQYNQDEFLRDNPGLACLSIVDNAQSSFNLNPNWVDSRQVNFEDTDNSLNPNALNIANARFIVKYLMSVKENQKVKDLIVHCVAGVSRSRAVCLFFQEVLNNNPVEDLSRTPYQTHNRLVYSQLVKAYREINYA